MGKFRRNMKMAELVETDFHLLAVLARFGIEGSFGERTVEQVCTSHGIDTDTFVLICELYSTPGLVPTKEQLRVCSIDDVLRYIHSSHDYYVKDSLVTLASCLERLILPCTEPQQKVIWKFFSDFKSELEKHFAYEEESILPHNENHNQIHETLGDLRSLILKSLPDSCDNVLRMDVLTFIFHLQADFDRHTSIEDDLLVPMSKLDTDDSQIDTHSEENAREELSDREKEILISVAEGLLNKQIADKHNISINTVITHRKNITRKTGIKTVAGLTVYAILNNLIEVR